MKFLLFNVMVVAALAYLILHAAPQPAPPVVAAAPPPPAPIPTIEAVIDVPVVKPQPLREGKAPPAAPLEPRPADRRKNLDQLIRDMELLAAKKLGQ